MKYYLLTISLLMGVLGCQSSNENAPETAAAEAVTVANEAAPTTVKLTPEQIQLSGIKVGEMGKRVLSRAVNCNGVIDVPPANVIKVFPPIEGYVGSFDLIEGQFVRKGERLFTIRHQAIVDLQTEYLLVKSKLVFMEKEHERQRVLAEGNATARKQFEQAQSDYQSLLAQKASLEAKMRLVGIAADQVSTEAVREEVAILSPVSGYVTVIGVNRGEMVMPDHEMLRLVDRSHLHAELRVFEKDAAQVREGQAVEVIVPGLAEPIQAFIKLTGQTVDLQTRTVNMHAHLPDGKYALKPGTFVNARIFLEADSVAAVPFLALVRNGAQYFLFAENPDGSFEKLPAQVGVQQDGFVAIANPETFAGKRVVLAGANYLEAALAGGEEE